MKQELVDLLSHPCRVILETLKHADCDFDIDYDGRNPHCRNCRIGQECRWLCGHDTLRVADRLSTRALIDALHFGRDTVALRVGTEHNRLACACDDCQWLRRSRRFLLDIGERPQAWTPG